MDSPTSSSEYDPLAYFMNTTMKFLYLSQLMHTNYFNRQTVKTFNTIIFAPTCFVLHKPSSGSYSLRIAKVTVWISICKSLLRYSVLWLHISFSRVVRVHYALRRICTVHNAHERVDAFFC